MKSQELKELHGKTTGELIKLLKDAEVAFMKLKLDHQQNKLENTSSISTTRKNIAIMQTILNMKQKSENKVKADELVAEKAKAKKAEKGGKE